MFTKNSDLKSFHDFYAGRRAVIVANGPSALNANLDDLDEYVVIGMNASWFLQDKFHSLRFDCYCFSDLRFIKTSQRKKCFESVLDSDVSVFMRSEFESVYDFKGFNNCYFLDSLGKTGFSKDIVSGFYFGNSTTVMALQLAYYLGVSEVFLVGVDMNYPTSQSRFYVESDFQIEDSTLSSQIHNMLISKKEFEKVGRSVYVSSEKSLLRPYFDYKAI